MRRRLASIAVVSLGIVLASASRAAARDLTFEERVKAQEAIERVYYSHQIGTTKPFEEAVPQTLREQKVRTYLKQTVALEKLWHTPVTAEMLHGETERMVRQTQMPERLRELYAALGNDPFLIQECLARPRLVDRLTRSFFAFDGNIHDEQHRAIVALRSQLVSGTVNPWSDTPLGAMTHLVRGGSKRREEPESRVPAGHREAHELSVELEPSAFDQYRARLPDRIGEIGPVEEDRDTFTIHVVLNNSVTDLRFVTYSVRKLEWNVWWQSFQAHLDEGLVQSVATAEDVGSLPEGQGSDFVPISTCPADDTWDNRSLGVYPRQDHTVVWTGSLMLVWGGYSQSLNGARYDPATDTWTQMSTINAPLDRNRHTAVWTGSLMVVWGGSHGLTLNTGGRYDPSTDTWTPTSIVNAPLARRTHNAVWTGTRMVVWGGHSDSSSPSPVLNTGGQYDPATDSWTPTSTINAPSPRDSAAAVWTGSAMLVWGGFGGISFLDSGGRYDPATDVWAPLSTINAPAPRELPTAVWTGGMMIVWGGVEQRTVNSGGRYDPVSDTWLATSLTDAPSPRYLHTAVWTGKLMVVWGGYALTGNEQFDTGGRYDPVADSWSPTSTTSAPSPRRSHSAIWTGSIMVVWGGAFLFPLNTGGRYEPVTDTWTPTSTSPTERQGHTSIWTGNEMIIWGGAGPMIGPNDTALNTGGQYDPATDVWTSTSTVGAPSPRGGHAAVWTGRHMVVWGGRSGSTGLVSTGGRYDPMTDTWTDTSVVNAPSPRSLFTAVWTGKEMIVWGGSVNSLLLNSGGRYDPEADTWVSTSLNGAPDARAAHTSVWTGRVMIVWGGYAGNWLGSGGMYDPATDSWTPTTTNLAPAPRNSRSAIWTGSVMVVWGGGTPGLTNTGGRYDPATDTWSPTSTIDAPTRRIGHTAIWTGRLMVVWGGSLGGFGPYDPGGRYDPITDTWTHISSTNTPDNGPGATATWTGSLMIVWGGNLGGWPTNTGGRYVVATDNDADGFTVCQGDCNDDDAGVHPGAPEVCDGRDNNCNGSMDEGFQVGQACAADVDACHRVVGTLACLADKTGTKCTGDVSFHDGSPPIVTCPANVGLECPANGENIGQAVASDACDPRPQIVSDSAASLPLGAHVITWTAMDASGNSSSCRQTVTVADTIPPQISLLASPSVLWPPNHRLVPVTVGWQVSDRCDPAPHVALLSVVSDEADDSADAWDGNTSADVADAMIGTQDSTVLLRAERSGDGPGRVYTLTYAARDASGNTASALGIVTVPHDEGTGPEPVMMSLEGDGTPGMAHLYWNAVNGAEMYDVIQGDLSQVSVSNGEISLGPVHVLASGQSGASYFESLSGAIPTVGSAFFYLVQYRDAQSASGWGTESSPWPAEPSSCDIGCPGEPVAPSVASITIKRK